MPAVCTLNTGTGTSNGCSATWTPASNTEGSYSMTASYGGDPAHAASSTASPTALIIRSATTTTITSCPTPAVFGVSESCTVIVTNGDSGYATAATGTITF